ncbi:MAG: hypothetical protein ACFCGT_22495 [Sandaracinaceae bacterium]
MNEQLQALCLDMRRQVPGSMAAGFFSVSDGRMLAVDSSVPDTQIDHMNESHVRIFGRMTRFLQMLPDRITGEMHSVVLDLEPAIFFMTMDRTQTLVAMVACDTNRGSLGMLRVVSKRGLERAVRLLGRA